MLAEVDSRASSCVEKPVDLQAALRQYLHKSGETLSVGFAVQLSPVPMVDYVSPAHHTETLGLHYDQLARCLFTCLVRIYAYTPRAACVEIACRGAGTGWNAESGQKYAR